jgi:hypothetical protein
MKLSYVLLPIFLLAAGCASKPDDITGYYVSPYKYRDFTCADIALEALTLNNRFLVSQGKTAHVLLYSGLLFFSSMKIIWSHKVIP